MPAVLNAPQREAIRYLDGPCLVLAGAGSGKTRVITHKIAYLLEECGMLPGNIAAITFTNKAAREMQHRLGALVRARAARGVTVCTFHALGVRIIRQEAAACGLKPQFSILDASDATQIVQELAADADKGIARQMHWQISAWKNALISPDEAAQQAHNELSIAAANLYREYERTLRAWQAVDFDDLIALPVRLFETQEDVRTRWQHKLRYLLIDEYQDTNHAQYRLLRLLAGERGMFTAVGDDDQAIYAWRGADVENLRQLSVDYPRLKVIKLEQNYRSSKRILEAANTLIAHNEKLFEKKLWSDLGAGDPIQAAAAASPEDEARRVVDRISAHRFRGRARYADYAILYRSNHQARLFEQHLRAQRIPYVLSGGQSFFEKPEIRDFTAWLRVLANPDDDLAFIRSLTTPRRGIGAGTIETLSRFAAEHKLSLFAASLHDALPEVLGARPLKAVQDCARLQQHIARRAEKEPADTLLSELLQAIHYEAWLFARYDERDASARWDNVLEFVQWLGRKGQEEGRNLFELIQTVSLITMLDKDDEDFDGVQLATLHAAKGLEFAHVFLVGLEEGLLPHQASIDEDKVEEERRLMYVGITRARQSLHLSWCERRKQGRESRLCEPSRFLAEMGAQVQVLDRHAPVSREDGRARAAQLLQMLKQGEP